MLMAESPCFSEKKGFGISNADYLFVAVFADIVVSFNPTLNSPAAHIQSEILGDFSAKPGLK